MTDCRTTTDRILDSVRDSDRILDSDQDLDGNFGFGSAFGRQFWTRVRIWTAILESARDLDGSFGRTVSQTVPRTVPRSVPRRSISFVYRPGLRAGRSTILLRVLRSIHDMYSSNQDLS